MKRSVLFRVCFIATMMIIGVAFSATKSYAQNGENSKTPEERAKALSDKMKTELSLTDEQYEKVQAVNLKYAKKNDEILKSSKGKLSKYKSVKASQDEKKKEMKAILTEEQFKKYEDTMEEKQNEARERYKNRNG